jgi:hypothetical protein
MTLRKKLIRLAYVNRDLRPHLLPLLRDAFRKQAQGSIKDYFKHPGDVTSEEARAFIKDLKKALEKTTALKWSTIDYGPRRMPRLLGELKMAGIVPGWLQEHYNLDGIEAPTEFRFELHAAYVTPTVKSPVTFESTVFGGRPYRSRFTLEPRKPLAVFAQKIGEEMAKAMKFIRQQAIPYSDPDAYFRQSHD